MQRCEGDGGNARGRREITFECLDRKSVSRCTQWNLQCPGKPAHPTTRNHSCTRTHTRKRRGDRERGARGMRSLAAITTRERAQKPECKTNGRRPQDADEVQRRQDKGHNHKLTLGHTHTHPYTRIHTHTHRRTQAGKQAQWVKAVSARSEACGRQIFCSPLSRFDSIRISSNIRVEEGQSALF